MTMFTENNITLSNCNNSNLMTNTNQTCLITDRLDGNCICQNYKNYYTVGEEDMNFVFDYKYLTTFQTGSNFQDHNTRAVRTRIYSTNGTLVKVFEKNTNIKFSVGEWLDILNVDLDGFNEATKLSEPANDTTVNRPRYRITGLQIIINIDCTNLVKKSKIGYGETICEIHPYINDGWASKGSHITYEQYPNLNEDIITSKYYDRYRYGLKFKFQITGKMGVFHHDKLISAIINAIVMMGTCASLVILIISNFCCNYTERVMNESTDVSRLHVDKCKSCDKETPSPNPVSEQSISPMSSLSSLESIENSVIKKELNNITDV